MRGKRFGQFLLGLVLVCGAVVLPLVMMYGYQVQSNGTYGVCATRADGPTTAALDGEVPEHAPRYITTNRADYLGGYVECEWERDGELIWQDVHQIVPPPILLIFGAVAGAGAVIATSATWHMASAARRGYV